MNGHVLPGVPVAVDFWNTRGRHKEYIYFLSHLHGDHIVGLTSTWSQPIYCSPLTAEILHKYHGLSKSLLCHLTVNEPVIIPVPKSRRTFCVTAFDANHCPGALMFYFQGDFGNIFYTGDFRFSSDIMSSHLQKLHGKVDTLYLDNTFCSPKCQFPPREECLTQIINVVRQHPNHDIIIGIRKLGKEEMLVELGIALDETIYVSPQRLSIIQLLYSTNIFSTVSDAKNERCRIRTVPFNEVSSSYIYKLNEKSPSMAILPSAIFTGLPHKPFSRNPNVHVIPFSDHSSFPELMEFVKLLKPSHIIPIVKDKRGPFGTDLSDRLDMSCFKPFLNTAFPKDGLELHKQLLSGEENSLETRSDCLSKSHNDPCTSFVLSSTSHETKQNCDEDDGLSQENFSNNGKSRSKLKRKTSKPCYSKRKIAKGVFYSDDPDESQNEAAVLDGDSSEEQNIPCTYELSNLTENPSAYENKIVCVPGQTVLCPQEKEQHKDFCSQLLYSGQQFTCHNVKGDNVGLKSMQFSPDLSDRTIYPSFNHDNCNSDCEIAEVNCPSTSRDKTSQELHIKSASVPPFDCNGERTVQTSSQKIPHSFFKRLSEKNDHTKTNKSIILSLKSVIEKWETSKK